MASVPVFPRNVCEGWSFINIHFRSVPAALTTRRNCAAANIAAEHNRASGSVAAYSGSLDSVMIRSCATMEPRSLAFSYQCLACTASGPIGPCAPKFLKTTGS
jgi:hypothetical protein